MPFQMAARDTQVQRDFLRLKMPARVHLEGEAFPVRDLSPGGVGVEGIARNYGDAAEIPVRLLLPFDGVVLHFRLTGRVRHYDHASKVLGLQFVHLTPAQASILTQVVKAYVAGDMLNEDDILKWVSDDSFIKVLHPNAAADAAFTARKKRGKAGSFAGRFGAVLCLLGFVALFWALSIAQGDHTKCEPQMAITGEIPG